MSFDPSIPQLPRAHSQSWREAYRHGDGEAPRLSTYQAPGGDPVPFAQENIRLSGGQSVDTGEYPFFGLWSNTTLNEKPQAITIQGFVRGEGYIGNRNALVESLRVTTDDSAPGFLDLPLWGRFPVVVLAYDVEEKGRENGQCSVSLTFSRAGVTAEARTDYARSGFDDRRELAAIAEALEEAVIQSFENALEGNTDIDTLAQGFTSLRDALISAVGRVQGSISQLNRMTNSVVGITNLIAQGVRSPRVLAGALFGAVASIIAGVMDVRNSFTGTVSFFRGMGNRKRLLLGFLSSNTFRMDVEAATVRQHVTRDSMENLYRAVSLCAVGQIMVQTEMTYQEALNCWALYENLESSVDQNNPDVYRAVRDMRLSASRELSARSMDVELRRGISLPVPLLHLSQVLGCDDEKLRQLNTIPNSFVIQGEVLYV